VVTNGRVASLLELGAGFHGDLTGRENIRLNGAILGLTGAEIDERFDEIVEFAGVRHLLDTAVRTYSSGLEVRLGFAVAVTVDPDILLVDEVLAVGDAEFQERSLERMRTFRDEGKTFLLVSHDLDAVRDMCDRAIVLDRGHVVFDGPVSEGVELYRQRVASRAAPRIDRRRGTRQVSIDEVQLVDADGEEATEVAPSSKLTARIRLRARTEVEICSVGLVVSRGMAPTCSRSTPPGRGSRSARWSPGRRRPWRSASRPICWPATTPSPARSPTPRDARPGRWSPMPHASRSARPQGVRAWWTCPPPPW
jgi:ABC-2 type transport system ATP-binding protein